MNKRIIKKKIKKMIPERNPRLKSYSPMEQWLDLESTKELLVSWHKPPTRINLKRAWKHRLNKYKNSYNYTKNTYNYLKQERSYKRMKINEFWKWLREENKKWLREENKK